LLKAISPVSAFCDRVGRRSSRRTRDGVGSESEGALPVIRVRKPARAAFVDKRRRWTSHFNSTAPDGEVKLKGMRARASILPVKRLRDNV
jgi:hypothetical protein